MIWYIKSKKIKGIVRNGRKVLDAFFVFLYFVALKCDRVKKSRQS
jgi:hypothetical protein